MCDVLHGILCPVQFYFASVRNMIKLLVWLVLTVVTRAQDNLFDDLYCSQVNWKRKFRWPTARKSSCTNRKSSNTYRKSSSTNRKSSSTNRKSSSSSTDRKSSNISSPLPLPQTQVTRSSQYNWFQLITNTQPGDVTCLEVHNSSVQIQPGRLLQGPLLVLIKVVTCKPLLGCSLDSCSIY